MNWYAVKTNPQSEKKAAGELRRAGMRVYLPTRSYQVRNRKSGKESVKFRPLLIGYLFVRFPPEMVDPRGTYHFGYARACQGVREFVRVANAEGDLVPFPIPEAAVTEFIRRQRRREFGRPAVQNKKAKLEKMRQHYRAGTRLRVTDGPFASFLAILERLNDDCTLDVEVTIFNRPTKINMGIDQVEAIATIGEAA